jgi:hypothetical protein
VESLFYPCRKESAQLVTGEKMTGRNYSLLGPDGARAVETGLAAAEWYHTDVPRKVMKDLMQRSDQPAIRDTVILVWLHDRLRRHRHCALAKLVVTALLARLRCPLRFGVRLAMA